MDDVPPRRNRRLIVFAILISALWMVVIYFVGPTPRIVGNFGNPNLRYPATYDWQLFDLDDKPVHFEKFKGKAIFLNIWATWCSPCIAEMPSIARLAENPRLRGKNVEFICVSTDENASPVRQYIRGKNWKMTFLRADSLPKAYLSDGVPVTFAIAPNGIVVGVVEGSSDWDNPEVVDFLSDLADSKIKKVEEASKKAAETESKEAAPSIKDDAP